MFTKILCILAASSMASCVSIKSDSKLFIFSKPDGASVLVNGQDSGFTTPAVLEPGNATITIVKNGYKSVSRRVGKNTQFRYPRWNDGGTSDVSIAMSIMRTCDDFFFPFQWSTRSSPNRIYVVLQPANENAQKTAAAAMPSSVLAKKEE